MPKWDVEIEELISEYYYYEVEAETEDEAEKKALDLFEADRTYLDSEAIVHSVHAITERR